MSLVRTRPIDTLQRIISSFKQFEKKLDQLQDDVTFHGHTLSDLRVMIANLSNANGTSDKKLSDIQRHSHKTMQVGDNINETKIRRKGSIQPLPTKLTRKNIPSPNYVIKPSKEPYQLSKINTSPNIRGFKRNSRQRKAEAPRKATMLRPKESKKARKKSPQKSF